MTEKPVAMLSGASRGIGAAIATHLAGLGWDLSLGMRRPAAAPATASGGGGAMLHAYDCERAGAEAEWVAATIARFRRIDAIICNAGLMVAKSAIDVTEAEMAAMFTVNVFAPQRLAQAAWPALCASGRGRIVVISSLSGMRVASASSGPYAMTKFAARALTHALRHAGWEAGIRATAICPGFVATDMAMAITDTDPAAMTQPQEVARLVALALTLPNTASVPEIAVNARIEGNF